MPFQLCTLPPILHFHHLIDGIHRKAPPYKKTIQFRFPTNTVSCLSSSETLTKTQAKTTMKIEHKNLESKYQNNPKNREDFSCIHLKSE